MKHDSLNHQHKKIPIQTEFPHPLAPKTIELLSIQFLPLPPCARYQIHRLNNLTATSRRQSSTCFFKPIRNVRMAHEPIHTHLQVIHDEHPSTQQQQQDHHPSTTEKTSHHVRKMLNPRFSWTRFLLLQTRNKTYSRRENIQSHPIPSHHITSRQTRKQV